MIHTKFHWTFHSLWVRKIYEKNTNGWKKFKRFFIFWHIPIENHSEVNSGRQNQKENFNFPGVVDVLQNLWGSVGSACITLRERCHFQNFRGNNILINAAIEYTPPSNKRRIHFTQILINDAAFIRWNTVSWCWQVKQAFLSLHNFLYINHLLIFWWNVT